MRLVTAIACPTLLLLVSTAAQAQVIFNTTPPPPPPGFMEITVTLKSVAVPPAPLQGSDRDVALNAIRQDLYEEAKAQCPILSQVYAATCRVTSVNIFRSQAAAKDGPPSFSITGTAKYELKTSDGDKH
ncbi:hypothetical protein [Bradyrhizobium sp. USDA 3364]